MNDVLTNPFVRHLIWTGLILPGGATLVMGLILRALTRGEPHRHVDGLWSLPVLAGQLSGYFAVYHDWSLWPHTVLGWLPALAVFTVILAGPMVHRGPWLRSLSIAVLVAIASGVILAPLLHQTSFSSALRVWAVVAVIWWLLWVGLTGAGHREQRGAAGTQLVLAAGLAAAGPLSQSILLGQLAMVLGAAWAAFIVLSWLRLGLPLTAPAADLGALVLGVLYIELWYYAAAPWRVVLAMLVAAALGALAHRITQPLSPTHRLQQLFIPAAVTAVPTFIGVYLAWQGYAASSGGY